MDGFEEEEEEKKPNLEVILGLWLLVVLVFSHCCCFSLTTLVCLSLGIDVQKALLHPVTIFDSFSSPCVSGLGFWENGRKRKTEKSMNWKLGALW